MAEYNVTFDELDGLLKSLPENTVDTPYDICITEITEAQCKGNADAQEGTLQYVLQNNSAKYIGLSFTSLPEDFTNASYMLYDCTSLTAIDTSAFTNVTNAFGMFAMCTYLATIDTSGFTNVTDASYMFYNCPFLTTIDKSGFTNVTNATYMFKNCISLTTIDTTAFTNVTNASYMFEKCTSLTTIDTSAFTNVTDTSLMFCNCTSLTIINKWGFDLSKLTRHANMLYNCPMSDIYCKSAELPNPYDGSSFPNITQEVTDVSNFINNTLGISGVTIHKGELIYNTPINTPFVHLNTLLTQLPENTTETPYEVEITEITKEQCYGSTTAQEGTLQYVLKQNNTKYIGLSFTELPSDLTGTSNMFYGCKSLTSIDTSAFTNVAFAQYMFDACTSLKSIDMSGFINIKITDYMFSNCTSLISVKSSPFTNVTDANFMFRGCISLKSIDTSSFINVTKVNNMFAECESLTSIDTSAFSHARRPDYIFSNCKSLTVINKWGFKASLVEYPLGMFNNCPLTDVYCKDYTIPTPYDGSYINTYGDEGEAKSILSRFGLSGVTVHGGTLSYDTPIKTPFVHLYTLLSQLPENTIDKSYPINITEITAEQCKGNSTAVSGTLQYVLQRNNKKYLGLSFTSLPEDFTNASYMFYYCTSLTTIDTSAFTNVTNASHMFDSCSSLTPIDTSVFTNVTRAEEMFCGCISLTTIDTSGFTNVTDARGMFYSCTYLTTIDTSGFTNITDAYEMFRNCLSLTTIDTSGLTNVTNARGIFNNCSSLTTIDTSGFTNVTNASDMFWGCKLLTSIDTSAFTNVTDASNMFYECTSLTTIDTSVFTNVTNAIGMFVKCTSLTTIDASVFINVTNVSDMFYGCTSLTTIDTSAFTKVTNTSYMFNDCTSLTTINKWGFDLSKLTDYINMFTNCPLSGIYCNNLVIPNPYDGSDINFGNLEKEATDVRNFINNTLGMSGVTVHKGTFSYSDPIEVSIYLFDKLCSQLPLFNTDDPHYDEEIGYVIYPFLISDIRTVGHCNSIGDTLFHYDTYCNLDFKTFPSEITDGTDLFHFYKNATSNVCNINTSLLGNITNANHLFSYCLFSEIDLSVFDKVTTAWEMFLGSGIESVDISSMKNLENEKSMFCNCHFLKTFTNNGATKIDGVEMFMNCTALESVDTSCFINATKTDEMFYKCISLKSVDTSVFTNVTRAEEMFYGCTSLTNIDTSAFTNVTDAYSMFEGCTSLTSIDTSAFTNVIYASNMFRNCISLTTIDKWGFNTSKLTSYAYMFTNCPLTDIYCKSYKISDPYDGSNIDIGHILESNFYDMFGKSDVTFHYGELTYDKPIRTPFEHFESLLFYLPVNNKSLLYPIAITEIEADNCKGTNSETPIGNTLQAGLLLNPTKFIDLSFEAFPQALTNGRSMFERCDNLVKIDTTKFGSLQNTDSMFMDCTNLYDADVSGFNDVITTTAMYKNTDITEADFSNFTQDITDASSMFEGCEYLEKVDMNSVKIDNLTSMFSGCTALTDIYQWNIGKEATIDSIFDNCSEQMKVHLIVPKIEERMKRVQTGPGEFRDVPDWSLINIRTTENKKVIKLKNSLTDTVKTIEVNSAVGDILEFYNRSDELTIGDINETQFNNMSEYEMPWGFKGRCLDPSAKNFVLWAADPDHVVSNVVSGGGGGGSGNKEVSKAYYESLSEKEKLNGTAYFIKDEQDTGDVQYGDIILNDDMTSTGSVWSSQKTDSELSALEGVINKKCKDITSQYQKAGWTQLYYNPSGATSSLTLNDDLSKYSEVCVSVTRNSDKVFWRPITVPVQTLIDLSKVYTSLGMMTECWSDGYLYINYVSGNVLNIPANGGASVVAVYAR